MDTEMVELVPALSGRLMFAPLSKRTGAPAEPLGTVTGMVKVPLPLTSMVQQMLITLMNEGKGDLDHSAIVNYIERMAGIEVKKGQTATA